MAVQLTTSPHPGASAAPASSAPASSAPAIPVTGLTVQGVGTEIIQYAEQNKASITHYSYFTSAASPPGARCVSLYSDTALAVAAQTQDADIPAGYDDPGESVEACGTGDFTAGNVAVTDVGLVEFTQTSGTDRYLAVSYSLYQGQWVLLAKEQTGNSLRSPQLSPAQVSADLSDAFALVRAAIPGGD